MLIDAEERLLLFQFRLAGGPSAGRTFLLARWRYHYSVGNGERRASDDHYFLPRIDRLTPCDRHWSALERQSITGHRWWARPELTLCEERIWPRDLGVLLVELGVWETPA